MTLQERFLEIINSRTPCKNSPDCKYRCELQIKDTLSTLSKEYVKREIKEGDIRKCPDCNLEKCEAVNVGLEEGFLWSCECGFEEPIFPIKNDGTYVKREDVIKKIDEWSKKVHEEQILMQEDFMELKQSIEEMK